jgi:hypothetical protein
MADTAHDKAACANLCMGVFLNSGESGLKLREQPGENYNKIQTIFF